MMAQLIKLPSGLVVNLDNVTHITNSGAIFGVTPNEGYPIGPVTDEDATTLRAWLNNGVARDIAAELAGRKAPEPEPKIPFYQDELVWYKDEPRHVLTVLTEGRLVLDNGDTVLQSEVFRF